MTLDKIYVNKMVGKVNMPLILFVWRACDIGRIVKSVFLGYVYIYIYNV